ncbi:MAG: SBBP repeat-containing protein [Bacteroidia bacterium]|nr:SBBP repeat-containing protein [Bacteroidia bacterium]
MKKIIFSFFTFFTSYNISAQAPAFEWVKKIGATSTQQGLSMAIDPLSNAYHLSFFGGTVDFDPGIATYTIAAAGTTGGGDFAVTKLDANGDFVWAKSFGGTSNDVARSISLDVSGNIYVAGYFQGTCDFDPSIGTFTLTSAGNYDAFVLKLNANGDLLWVKKVGGTADDRGYSIKVDASGNVYSTGSFLGNADFDLSTPATQTLTSKGQADVYVLKLDPNGNFVWVKQLGGSQGDFPKAIDLDASGNSFVSGSYSGTCDFDPSVSTYTVQATGASDIFLSKLDAAGNFVWAKSFGSVGTDVSFCVNIDNNDNILIGGLFEGTVDFDLSASTNTLTSYGFQDACILKLDVNGDYVWAKQMGCSIDNDQCNAISTDALGNVYATGIFFSNADFDTSASTYTLQSNGQNDVFISKFDANGNLAWAKSFGSSGSDITSAICVDANNKVFSTGYYSGTTDFDPDGGVATLTNSGSDDIYIHKMGLCTIVPNAPANTTLPVNQVICENNSTILSASSAGTINWYATATTTTTALFAGTNYSTNVLSSGTYTFYAEAYTCTTSATRSEITITVNILPNIIASTNNTLLCSGQTATLTTTGADTYTWSTTENTTSIAVSPTIQTTYTVIGTDANGCSNSSIVTQSVSLCTGITQLVNESTVSVFPNPFNDVITIRNSFENYNIVIVDVLGKVVFEKQTVSSETSIDLSELKTGFYQLIVKGEDNSYTQKIIKQ